MFLIKKNSKSNHTGFFSKIFSFFEGLFTWKRELAKFIEWTEKHNLKINKIEGCSYIEAGFSFSQISQGHSCAKMEVVTTTGEIQGLYLMMYNWADSNLGKSRFVLIEEINFSQSYGIVDGKLIRQ